MTQHYATNVRHVGRLDRSIFACYCGQANTDVSLDRLLFTCTCGRAISLPWSGSSYTHCPCGVNWMFDGDNRISTFVYERLGPQDQAS